jgi:hypothetical protein
MKKLPFIITFLLSAQLGIAQTIKNSLSEQHLKGKVKRIETGSFNGNPADGKIDTLAPHATFIDLFDENGNETEDSYFGKDGLIVSKLAKKYNEKGQATEEDYFTKGDVLESTTLFKYSVSGNLVESDHEFKPDKTHDKTIYKYDEQGNCIEDDVFNSGDSLRYKDTYKYDVKGNKIEMDYWHANEDTMRVKWTFSYNDAGLQVQQGRYTPSGGLGIENTFTYENLDRMGNWQKETRTSKGLSKQFAKISSYSVTVRKIYYY